MIGRPTNTEHLSEIQLHNEKLTKSKQSGLKTRKAIKDANEAVMDVVHCDAKKTLRNSFGILLHGEISTSRITMETKSATMKTTRSILVVGCQFLTALTGEHCERNPDIIS